MCTLSPTLRHSHTPTHTHTRTHTKSTLQGRRISHGLPRACLCCSECIATGNLTHHSTRGSSASAASLCSQLLAAPNLLSERKQHPAHSHPTTVSVNYGEFSNHLHASIHLAELKPNCHHPLRSQGSEGKCSAVRHNIRSRASLMMECGVNKDLY